jgi:hypothetical protein
MNGPEECVATESVSFANADVGLRSPARAKLLILIGAILAVEGILAPVAAFVLFYILQVSLGSFGPTPGHYVMARAIGSLLFGTGGFLVFLGFAQARRDSLPWTLVAAVAMIVAGAIGAIAAGSEALLWLSTPTYTAGFLQSLQLFSTVQFAAWAALESTPILGLLAVARTLFRKL